MPSGLMPTTHSRWSLSSEVHDAFPRGNSCVSRAFEHAANHGAPPGAEGSSGNSFLPGSTTECGWAPITSKVVLGKGATG